MTRSASLALMEMIANFTCVYLVTCIKDCDVMQIFHVRAKHFWILVAVRLFACFEDLVEISVHPIHLNANEFRREDTRSSWEKIVVSMPCLLEELQQSHCVYTKDTCLNAYFTK